MKSIKCLNKTKLQIKNVSVIKHFSSGLRTKNLKKNQERVFDISESSNKQSLSFHLLELRDRSFLVIVSILLLILFNFSISKEIINIFEQNGLNQNFSFVQLSPGEFFTTSFDVSILMGLACSTPITLYHISNYVNPGLSSKETKLYFPLFLGSTGLFFLGVIFSFYILSPLTLTFFSNFNENSVEITLSIKKYFDFYFQFLLACGIAFQIPIIQIILIRSKIITYDKMLALWKWVVVLNTILGAIITPSTDPVTQLFTSAPLIVLYFLGLLVARQL
uniref:Thylakoid protein translocator TatC n=1 Tax=Gymnochlora stellata TaxID=67809 RepID=B5A4F8_GYMST|nr:thylakoid protein translocator TatC [Gymnochlora stellata]